MHSKAYRWCAVPLCTNTSIKTPEKLFIFVPFNKTIRNKWLKLARRDLKGILPTTQLYFCEDHFDLPNDMENYMEYHVMGSVSQIRMKRGCVPLKFHCQLDRRKRISNSNERSKYIVKKQRKEVIAEFEQELQKITITTIATEQLELKDLSPETSAVQLEKDMDNYMQYKIMGSVKRIRMKPGCVPSRFESQSKKRKRSSTPDLPISEDSEPIDPLEISTSSFQVKQEKEDDQLDNDLEVSLDIPVKQEKDLEVSFDIPNKEENGLEISCDISIKEENDLEITCDLPIKQEQAFVEDSDIHNTIPEHQDYQESISYEKLIEDFNDTCTVCNKYFNDRFSLYQHNLIHLKVRLHKHELFACDYSSYFVKNQTHLIERNPKRKARRSQCKICGKSFSYRYMHEHRRIVHGELKKKRQV